MKIGRTDRVALARPGLFGLVITVVFMALVVASSPVAHAQLQVELHAANIAHRDVAPYEIEAKLSWARATPIVGRLEVMVVRGEQTVHRLRSAELTLLKGAHTVRLLVPATLPIIPTAGEDVTTAVPETGATVTFVVSSSEDEDEDPTRLDLGSHALFVGGAHAQTRSLMIGVMVRSMDETALFAVASELRFDGEFKGSKKVATPTRTWSVPIFTDRVPNSALGYTPYDLVVVSGTTLATMLPLQLEALSRWVHGGGRLCCVGGTGFSAESIVFLNDLAATERFTVAQFGKLIAPEPYSLLRVGLGRVLVTETNVDPTDSEVARVFHSALQFLWRLQIDPRVIRDRLDRRVAAESPYASLNSTGRPPRPPARRAAWEEWSLGLRQDIRESLPTTDARPVPIEIIATILIVFLLIVGPLDYMFLGFLRRRRWTWILLPTVAIGVTMLTLRISHGYLGDVRPARTLTVVDIGKAGRVLRQNRFQLTLSASEREFVTRQDDTLYAALPAHDREESTPWLEGNLPGRYDVREQRRQWTYSFHRSLRLGPVLPKDLRSEPVIASLAIPWDELNPSAMFERSRTLKERLEPILPADMSISVVAPGRTTQWISWRGDDLPRNIIASLSTGPSEAHPLTALQAPTGSPLLEDIPLVSRNVGDEWLLSIMVRAGDHYVLYRRLYPETSP